MKPGKHPTSACLFQAVDWTLGTHNQIADQNLQDLGFQAGAAGKHLLQDGDQDVSQGGANESAVEGHLGHTSAEVVAVFGAIVGNP